MLKRDQKLTCKPSSQCLDRMASSTFDRRKKALVVGINKYVHAGSSLKTCIADAIALGDTLRSIGFEVLPGIDYTFEKFKHKIDEFVQKIQNGDVILFYFAGHGQESDGKNYLISSDYNYDHSTDENMYLANNAVNIQYILHNMTKKNPYVIIFILDCCRTRKIRTTSIAGLSPMNAPSETLLVFSCGPGKGALDDTGNGQNSIFMENLLQHIANPDEDIESLIMKVTRDVRQATGGYQIPYRTSSLTEKIFFTRANPLGKRSFNSI
ncbi:unnamed protein product [Rotaria magnacalcarata]|uniref:Caspase family p20 domain-containing protein n=1 Tax=Rotaria magnacalcarata TaxID=392030 RepID=A0A814MHT0_9BILA|nr:unnamed protein product [Rotaria magnacalcarata]CAF3922499.1 unnamed protein product [Rotaria magnacalcarata]